MAPLDKHRRRMIRWPLAVFLLIVAIVVPVASDIVRRRWAVADANRAIARRDLSEANARLESFKTFWVRPTNDAEFAYLLGLTRWSLGRKDQARIAFQDALRNPPTTFRDKSLLFLAEYEFERRRFEISENASRILLNSDAVPTEAAVRRLEAIYRLELRYDELRRLFRDTVDRIPDRLRVLHDLWVLDRGTVPPGAAQRDWKVNGSRGEPWGSFVRARIALLRGETRPDITLAEGVGDPAARWLRLDAARASGDAAAVVALLREDKAYGELRGSEAYGWRAWVARASGDRAGEIRALEGQIQSGDYPATAPARLAELATKPEDAARWRSLKTSVDAALHRYERLMADHAKDRRAVDPSTLAGVAKAAGRAFDAAVWRSIANGNAPLDVVALTGGPTITDLLVDVPRNPVEIAKEKPTAAPDVRLVDRAEAAGIRFTFHNDETPIRRMPEPLSGGAGLLDYDGDGRLDIYLAQGGSLSEPDNSKADGDRLYRNIDGRTFVDATASAGIDRIPRGYGHGVAVGDIDNDGDPDLFLTRYGSYRLLRNDGGTFTDVTDPSGLGGTRDWPTSAAFGDLDGDGDLDLYVCHYLEWTPDAVPCRDGRTNAYIYCPPRNFRSLPDHLFRNDGGKFVDVTKDAGIVDEDGRGLGVVMADLDADGRLDIYVANDTTANYWFRNLGGMKFEDVGRSAGAAASADGGYQAGMGVACGDLDGDGRLDIAVTNFYGEGTSFFRNLGDGFFSESSAATGIRSLSRYRLGFGIAAADFNADGRLDLLTADGHLNDSGDVPYRMPLQLLLGTSDGRFAEPTDPGPDLAKPRLGRALACGDLDDDGRLDAVVIDQNAPVALLYNETPTHGRSVAFRLIGTRSGRDAVGALVRLRVGGKAIVAPRAGGGSYQAASDGRVYLGVGAANRIDEAEIVWPSGARTNLNGLAVDSIHEVHETEGLRTSTPFRRH